MRRGPTCGIPMCFIMATGSACACVASRPRDAVAAGRAQFRRFTLAQRAALEPLLLRHRVHVYFCGDDHTLQAPPRARPTTHGMIL